MADDRDDDPFDAAEALAREEWGNGGPAGDPLSADEARLPPFLPRPPDASLAPPGAPLLPRLEGDEMLQVYALQGPPGNRRPAAYRNSVTLGQLAEFFSRFLRPPGPRPPFGPPPPPPPAWPGSFRVTPDGRLLVAWGNAWVEPDGAPQVRLTRNGDLLVRIHGRWIQPRPSARLASDGSLEVRVGDVYAQPDPGYRLAEDGTLSVRNDNGDLVEVPGTGADGVPGSQTIEVTAPVTGAGTSASPLGVSVFTATQSGVVPAPDAQTKTAVPANLFPFYSCTADTIWRPKLGGFQMVTSGSVQIEPDTGFVLVDNQSGAPISLGLPVENDVPPGWIIRFGIINADPTQTVTFAAASGDAIHAQGVDVNPVVITSPRSGQFTAAGTLPWAFANFGLPTAQFAGFVPALSGAAGTYLGIDLAWSTPGGGGGSPVMPDIPQNTVLGSVTAGNNQPSALTPQQLAGLIGTFTQALAGMVAAPGVSTPNNWALRPNNIFAPYAQAQLRVDAAYTATATDEVINIGTAGVPVTLPLASSRSGLVLEINDVSGQAETTPIPITAASPDTVSGLPSITISSNYGSVRLRPANDGTTQGWQLIG